MKKTIMLLASALMLAGSASAQNTAESLFKSGKAAFEAYDKDLGTMQLSPDKVDKDQMAANLLKGFADFQEALPLDSVKKLNKDGSLKKIETKYSKKIVPILCAHIGDLIPVAGSYFDAQKFDIAASVYAKYLQYINSPMAANNKVLMPADTVMGKIYFLKGLSEYYIKSDKDAILSFNQALKLGFSGEEFKVKTSDYIDATLARLLEAMLNSKDFEAAYSLMDDVIKESPTNPTYQFLLGDVYYNDSTKVNGEAEAAYKKCLELDQNNAYANYKMGVISYNKAQDYLRSHSDSNDKELAPFLIPLYEEALVFFEKAKDNGQTGTEAFIKNIKYGLDIMKPMVQPAEGEAPTPAPAQQK